MKSEKIKNISFAIAEGTRSLMITTILEYAGDEIDDRDSAIKLAMKTDEELKFNLISIMNYLLDNNSTKYILFGEDAVKILDNEGIDELIEVIKDDCGHIYATFEYIEEETPLNDVLNAYDGWNAYSFISKEDFDKLNNI